MNIKRLSLFAMLLLALSLSAKAQNAWYLYTGDVSINGFVADGTLSQTASFTGYAQPVPPYFFLYSVSNSYWWYSTCPSGGEYGIEISKNSTNTQISIGASIINPFNSSFLQGLFAQYATVIGYPPFPVLWRPTIDRGGPCGPTSGGGRVVQTQQSISRQN